MNEENVYTMRCIHCGHLMQLWNIRPDFHEAGCQCDDFFNHLLEHGIELKVVGVGTAAECLGLVDKDPDAGPHNTMLMYGGIKLEEHFELV